MNNNKTDENIIKISNYDDDTKNINEEGLKNIIQSHPPKNMEHPLIGIMKEFGGCNGMAHTSNVAHNCDLIWNNFPHRTDQEVTMHKALYKMNQRIAKEKGPEFTFLYWPLPVAECLNQQRVELDFLVAINGFFFGLEVDGDSHCNKSHFSEEERLKFVKLNGIEVFRVKPNEQNPLWAEDWLISVFKVIKRKRGFL